MQGISSMDSYNDVTMAEAHGIDDPVALDSAGSGDAESGQASMDVEHSIESTPAVLKELVAPPCANGGRTRLQEEACDPSEASAKDEGAGSHPNEVGVNNAALEALAAVTDDQLLQRVMKMLTSVASGPVASGEPGLGGDALVAHCVRVKPVVFKVYEKHRSSVCRSPERPLQFTYSSVQWLCEHVGNEIRAVMCVALHYSAVQRDAVSRGVVSTCRLRCLDRSAVDTRAEFESPSGAPPGYVCCSLVDLALFGPAEQQAPLERVAHGGERVATRAARVSVARTTSACARSLVGPCAACAWSTAVILGAADACERMRA